MRGLIEWIIRRPFANAENGHVIELRRGWMRFCRFVADRKTQTLLGWEREQRSVGRPFN